MKERFRDVLLVLCFGGLVFIVVGMPFFERSELKEELIELKADVQEIKQLLGEQQP